MSIFDELMDERRRRGMQMSIPGTEDPLDLTKDDELVANTNKDPADDEFLPLPSQSPDFIPPSVVDYEGDPT